MKKFLVFLCREETRVVAILLTMLIPLSVNADTIIGPSPPPVTTTIDVSVDPTFVVGSTIISTGTTVPATNVIGSILSLDSMTGPSPGLINIQTLNGNALQANGGGIAASGVSIQTQGGHAVLSNGITSAVELVNLMLSTTGTGAGIAAIGGTVNATNTTINNLGTSTPTVSAGHGAIAESGGTVILGAGNSITTGAFNSVGLGASGLGSLVTLAVPVPLNLNGRGALGIYTHDGGQVSLVNNSVMQLNASNSVGVTADNTAIELGALGKGLTLNFNAVPAAGQAAGTGMVAFNNGSIAIEDVTVQGVGAGAGACARPGSRISLTGNSLININANANPTFYTLQTAFLVTTSGQVSSIFGVTSGLPIGGLLSNAGLITSEGTTINVTSNNGVGAYASFDTADPMTSTINMTDNTISTTGTNSFGIEAGSNGQITGINTQVTTSGGGAALLTTSFNGPSLIDLTNSTIEASGANTSGLASTNNSPDLTDIVNLTDSSITSLAGNVVDAFGGPLNLTLNNTTATATTGLLVGAVHGNFAPQETLVQFDASNHSVLVGDAQADAQSIINMDLATQSTWTGAAFDVSNVALDASSIWNMTKSSTVREQVTNAGLIAYVPSGNIFKTLTTTDYVGNSGKISLNTFLGSDGSSSDLLVINSGAATGLTSLIVNNTTGPGALTTGNGILVVDAINGGMTTTDAFTLGNLVVAGPYEYMLFRSSVDTSGPENWYLRSELLPPGPPIPNYRQEVSLYAALPSIALLYNCSVLDTLHQRVGEEEQLRCRCNNKPNAVRDYWMRVIRTEGKINNGDIFHDGPDFDYRFLTLQIGADIYRQEHSNGSRDHIGVYGAAGDGDGSVKHFTGIKAGDIDFDAYTLGGYWTHFGPTGWYIDTVIQGNRMINRANSHRLPESLKSNETGLAASLEGGYPFKVTRCFVIEPQIQIVHQRISLDNSHDSVATVHFDDTYGTEGRLGVRLANTWQLEPCSTRFQCRRELTAWVRGSIWREFQGDSTTSFSSSDGFVPFPSTLKGNYVQADLGVTAQVATHLSLYGSISENAYINGCHGHQYDAILGVRYNA